MYCIILTLVILCVILKFVLFGPMTTLVLPAALLTADANVDEAVESFDAFDICDEFIIELIMSAAVSWPISDSLSLPLKLTVRDLPSDAIIIIIIFSFLRV